MNIEQFRELLGELLDELPEAFFGELNGGVIVSPQRKENPHARAGDLLIMGEYHLSRSMGSQIVIYYGSFMALYANASREVFERELRSVLRHEFRHHMEFRAGSNDLQREDERNLADYLGTRACKVRIKYNKRGAKSKPQE